MVGNGIYFGPCTIRQYCAVFFFMYVCLNWKKTKGYSKLLLPYSLFVFLYGISSCVENNFAAYFRQFIAYYAVSIVAYFSTIIITEKYKSYRFFLDSFIVVGLLNAIVNILQYLNSPIGHLLGGVFVDINDEVKMSQFTHMINGDSAYHIGIMGDIVYNGYYSMILPFLLLLKAKHRNATIQIGLVLFSLISLFTVGERSCLGITVMLLVVYMFFKYRKSPIFYIVCFGLLLCVVIGISAIISSDVFQESRWAERGTDDVRDNINRSTIPFILNHLLLGDLQGFIKLTDFPPHNVIASGFIYAGILGGICILYMLVHQAKVSLHLLKKNHYGILIVLAFISYTLNGLFHNPAIVTGDVMVWILWGMVMWSYKQVKQEQWTRKLA